MVRDGLLAWGFLSVPLSVLLGRMIGASDATDHREIAVAPAGAPPSRNLVGVADGPASSRP